MSQRSFGFSSRIETPCHPLSTFSPTSSTICLVANLAMSSGFPILELLQTRFCINFNKNLQYVQIYNRICMITVDICVWISGWQSMVNDQVRAYEFQKYNVFVRNKVFVRQGFVQ